MSLGLHADGKVRELIWRVRDFELLDAMLLNAELKNLDNTEYLTD
jgi:hypothetical protein